VLSGWNLCKKSPADLDDPTAPCLAQYWDEGVAGEIVATFVAGDHDCTAKTIFAGTAQELLIPDTCLMPDDGVQDLFDALDAIAAHPATREFISRKIAERFVTDEPTQAMIDAVAATWMDGGNPQGVGDLTAILETTLALPEFLDPERIRSKIKTPLEHFASAARATRGITDGTTEVLAFLTATQHVLHANPTPTGWPEDGPSWIGTNNALERQNIGIKFLTFPVAGFRAEPIALLNAQGISTTPGNADGIVDFFSDTLFGGSLTSDERQAAIDFLTTDDSGAPSAYDDTRIREVVAFLLGYAQFQEQ
jgi:uncharacterized protein (DUF1800 family)